jgi:hypothetical protein
MRLFRTGSMIFGVLAFASLALAGEPVPFDGLPAAVKATIQREVKGGQIVEIERETKAGRPIFEVDFVEKNGAKWELDVAEDGTLLSREPD